MHPRDQLADLEGLGDVVVRTQADPGDDVGGGVAAREEQQRHAAQRQVGPQLPDELEPVHVGHVDIGHDHVRDGFVEQAQGLLGAQGGGHPVAGVRQGRLHEGDDHLVVVEDQHGAPVR
jgi:hypothetical protein